jgi:hypothetical protein
MSRVPPELLAAAQKDQIDIYEELIREFAQHPELTPAALLDELAIWVAIDYSSEMMTYTEADLIMNVAFSMVIRNLVEHKIEYIPPLMWEVYLAFDEGEYYHREDLPDVDPEVKYTKPLIAEFLAAHT